MKTRTVKLGGFILLLAVVTPLAAADVKPDITIQTIEPAIAAPGDTVRLSLVVANDGTTRGTFGPVELETVEGVAVIGSTSSLTTSFSLCGGCQRTGTFYLSVDENAVEGTYPVTVRFPSGDTALRETAEIEVDGKSNLVLTSQNISIVPGEATQLSVEIANIGTDAANDVVLSAETDGFSVSPSSRTVETIDAGEKYDVTFTLRADREMEAGVRNLGFMAVYTEDNEDKDASFSVPVDVQERADIAIDNVAGDAMVVNELSDLTVDIENLGPGQAERISTTLQCEDADVRNKRSFVGQLGDGESVPVVFTLVPATQQFECDLTIRYTDERERVIDERLTLSAQKEGSLLPYAGVIGVVIVGIGYLWRKRRKDEVAEI